MEQKRRSIITLLLLVIIIIVTLLVVYFLINSNKVSKELEDAKNTISTNLSKINELTEKIKANDELAAELAKNEVGKFVPFDSTKCLNKEEGMKYSMGTISHKFANINLRDKKVYIELTEQYKEQFLTEGLENPLNIEIGKEYEVKGFSKAVVDVGIYDVGHSVNQSVILFLIEDGTVEVLPIAKIRLDGLKTFGKIKGVEKVVRIINGKAEGDISSYVSPLAITENGGFYSLSTLLDEQEFLK